MIAQIIVLLIVVVMGMYIFGVGTNFLDDIVKSIDDGIKKQNEVPSATLKTQGNLAKDTHTRVCGLRITFYATMNDLDYDNIDFINALENRFIYSGTYTTLGGNLLPFHPAVDTRTFDYQWLCTGPLATQEHEASAGRTACTDPKTCKEVCGPVLGAFGIPTGEQVCTTASPLDIISWNIRTNTNEVSEKLSLLALGISKTNQDKVQIDFVGKSLTNSGKRLFTPADNKGTDENPFYKSIRLPVGADFPYSYRIEFELNDVTEDNYSIEYWDENYRQNNQPVGHIFDKKLCKPGLGVC